MPALPLRYRPRLSARRRFPAATRKASGIAAAEFIVAAIPLLLAGLGAFELARWHLVRQTVSYALLEAARAGSVNHGAAPAMQAALERALLPLHGGGRTPDERARSLARMQRKAAAFEAQHGLPPWRITVLSPTAADFAQHANASLRLPLAGGRRVINNAYQEEQQGRATHSGGRSIFEANTLVLRLTYLHEPLVPGLRGLLRQLGTGTHYGARAMAAAGVLPMSRDITVVMQSHPVQWGPDNSPLARVVWGDTAFNGQTGSPATCTGLWCQPTPPRPDPGGGTPPTPTNPTTPPGDPGTPPPGPQDPSLPPDSGTPTPTPTDPMPDTGPSDPGAGSDACGVTLCCPTP